MTDRLYKKNICIGRSTSKSKIQTLKLLHRVIKKLYGKEVANKVITRIEQDD